MIVEDHVPDVAILLDLNNGDILKYLQLDPKCLLTYVSLVVKLKT